MLYNQYFETIKNDINVYLFFIEKFKIIIGRED